METFCGLMDFPPPVTARAYSKSNERILSSSEEAVQAEYLSAADQLRSMSAAGTLFIPTPLTETDDEVESGTESDEVESGTESDEVESGTESDEVPAESENSSDDEQIISDLDNHDFDTASEDDDQPPHLQDPSHNDQSSPYLGRHWTSEPLNITVTFDGTWSKRAI